MTTRCRTQRRIQFRGKPACLDTHMATKRDNNHVAIPLRSATTDSKTPYITTHAKAHPKQSHCYSAAKKRAAHWRYLSSPPAATLHGKTQGFMLRLPPQNKAHVTFLQPLQCVCSITWLTRMYLHTWQQNVTTIMQPFHCDLQPQIPKHPI